MLSSFLGLVLQNNVGLQADLWNLQWDEQWLHSHWPLFWCLKLEFYFLLVFSMLHVMFFQFVINPWLQEWFLNAGVWFTCCGRFLRMCSKYTVWKGCSSSEKRLPAWEKKKSVMWWEVPFVLLPKTPVLCFPRQPWFLEIWPLLEYDLKKTILLGGLWAVGSLQAWHDKLMCMFSIDRKKSLSGAKRGLNVL